MDNPATPPSVRSRERAARGRVRTAVRRARLALLWESLWPRILPVLLVAAAFLTVSWFGLWRVLPDLLRFAVLGLFGLAALVAVLPVFGARLPGRLTALARVERVTATPHRPASSLDDRLAGEVSDPATRFLWAAHRERLVAGLGELRAGAPSPGLARRDPLALRFLAIIVLAVSFVFAAGQHTVRVAEAFRAPAPDVPPEEAVLTARIDAWATPPAYTGRPPVFLTGRAVRTDPIIPVPADTTVVVRIAGAATDQYHVWTTTPAGEVEIPAVAADAPSGKDGFRPVERHIPLAGEAKVSVRRNGETVALWQFGVVPDAPPAIAPTAQPGRAGSGAMQLTYLLMDDYGVVSAEARIAKSDLDAVGARPLYEPFSFPLSMPSLRVREAGGETIKDLTGHPWAGAHIEVTLAATDESGQVGTAEPMLLVMPVRIFTNPLAKAIVEQRRRLAMDATQAHKVADILDILTLAPEKHLPGDGAYMAIRGGYLQLVNARNDDDLRNVVDYLWEVALGIEDGVVSFAAGNLRAAQDAVRAALQRGAPPEELEELMNQLRQATKEFMQAVAEQNRQDGNQGAMTESTSPQLAAGPDPVQQMMDQIEQLGESGAFEAAQSLLNQLQTMMENQQEQAQRQGERNSPGSKAPQGGDEIGQALDQLGEMIQQQQELLDDTYALNQNGNRPGMGVMNEQELENYLRQSPGRSEEQIQETLQNFREGRKQFGDQLGNLQEGQRKLQEALDALSDELKEMGEEPDEALEGAGKAMAEAQSQFRAGQINGAFNQQGQALDQLRASAQAMAEKLAEEQSRDRGGEGMEESDVAEGRADPLGRQRTGRGTDFGTQVDVPDVIESQRARDILDTIRRRLGEASRPIIERNYLERLLKLY